MTLEHGLDSRDHCDENAILSVEDLWKSFGGVQAVKDVSLTIRPGEIHSLIGPNGAGKSTVFNLATGLIRPDRGSITFHGQKLAQLRPDQIARLGVARTFQNIKLFPDMTVFETVLAGTYPITGGRMIPALLRTKTFRRLEKRARERVSYILEFMGIWSLRDEKAVQLSYGNQRRVEIARALVAQPSLLLLDEPTAGMNPIESRELLELFTKVNESGITLAIIAHDMELVMNLSSRVTVLNFGQVLASGSPDEIRKNDAVWEAYVGRRKARAN